MLFRKAIKGWLNLKKKSSPSSVRSSPADRQVHDDTSTASSITGREKHQIRVQNLDTVVTETDAGSVAHGDSGV